MIRVMVFNATFNNISFICDAGRDVNNLKSFNAGSYTSNETWKSTIPEKYYGI
jgi:hypothetical protein